MFSALTRISATISLTTAGEVRYGQFAVWERKPSSPGVPMQWWLPLTRQHAGTEGAALCNTGTRMPPSSTSNTAMDAPRRTITGV